MQFATGFDNNTQDNMLRQEAVEIVEDDNDGQLNSRRLSLRSDGNQSKNGYNALGDGELETDAQI